MFGYRTRAWRRKVILGSCACALAGGMLMTPANATLSGLTQGDILDGIQTIETGGMSNPWAASAGGAYGTFQQRKPALVEIGYMNKDGSWNSQASGASSLNDYLQCTTCQIAGEKAYLNKTWGYLNSGSGSTASKYMGQKAWDGNTYNESALLQCGSYFGPTGCRDYLDGNMTPFVKAAIAADPHIAADLAKASQYDSSSITQNYTPVDNSANAAGGTLLGDAAAASMLTYCAKEIQDLMSQAGMQEVDKQTMLAGSKEFGYTLMDGNGILDDAGDGTTAGKGFDGLSQVGYNVRSCLDNLLSQVSGISTMFTKPSLSTILNQIVNAACSAAQSQLSQAMSPLYEKVGNLNNATMIGGGGWFPSQSLGSFNISQGGSGTTGCSSGECSVSFSSLLSSNDASWYKSADDATTSSFNYLQKASDDLGTNTAFGSILN